MQSVHIRLNSHLSSPLKNPGFAYVSPSVKTLLIGTSADWFKRFSAAKNLIAFIFQCACSYAQWQFHYIYKSMMIGEDFSADLAIRNVTRGGRGAKFPGAELVWRRRMAAGGKKSHQCHKYSLQYRTFASERPQSRTRERQTCFLPRAPSNLVRPLLTISQQNIIIKITAKAIDVNDIFVGVPGTTATIISTLAIKLQWSCCMFIWSVGRKAL